MYLLTKLLLECAGVVNVPVNASVDVNAPWSQLVVSVKE